MLLGSLDQNSSNFLRQELRQVAAKRGDLPQERAAHVRELFLGHQEHGFDLGVEVQVHQRHGELVFHVAQGAQAADHDRERPGCGQSGRPGP